jgi:hypothetical protein
MTKLINGYRSVTPPVRPLPHARPGARAEWMMATAASFLKGHVRRSQCDRHGGCLALLVVSIPPRYEESGLGHPSR